MTISKVWIVSPGFEDAKPTRLYKNIGYKTKKSRRTNHKQHKRFWDFLRTHSKGTD
jgi:hypothetical protein